MPDPDGPAVRSTSSERARVALRHPVVAGLLLLLVYGALSLAMDEKGYLGTDTGGKVATVLVMSERGDFDPDVGYWAASWDPDGTVHDLYYTVRIGDRYVNVTSLPMVLAARPLWDLGGYRATLVLPMLGGLAAALAARAMARRLHPASEWRAFWLVGLASPVAVYALDLWEHSIGLGLMAWGVLVAFDAVERAPTWWRGLLVGGLFGAAAAMRTESFVYVLGSVAISCGVLGFSRRRWGGAFLLGALAIVGFAAVFLTNLLLEGAVLGEQIRGSRASGAASGGLDELLSRAEEGLLTFATPTPRGSADSWMVGLVLAGALALLARWSTRRGQRRLAVGAAVLVGIVYLLRAVDGLGFVPGMVAATPFVGVALGLGWDDVRSRLLLAYAFVPLPLVFAFQFRGGALPQWAGRYILLSGLVAGVVGIAASSRMAPWARRYVTLLAVGVTCFGLAWLSLRSHDVAAAGARFVERPEEVLVSPDGFVPREFGAFYGERRWLSANPDTLPTALDVLDRSGIEEWGLVEVAPPEQPRVFDGWVVAGVEEVPFLDGAPLTVTTYRRA